MSFWVALCWRNDTCSFRLISEVSWAPKYLQLCTEDKEWPPTEYEIFKGCRFRVIVIVTAFLGLMRICHVSHRVWILPKEELESACSLGLRISLYRKQSFANSFIFTGVWCVISLIKMRKSCGPSTHLWGMPDSTDRGLEQTSSIFTLWHREYR